MIESVAEPEPSDDPVARVSASGIAEALSGRVARLEDLVESLREELDRLKLASQKEPVA